MHVPFKIHYRNNLIDKKDSYLITRPTSWDDRNCSYHHQLYPSEPGDMSITTKLLLKIETFDIDKLRYMGSDISVFHRDIHTSYKGFLLN